MAERDDFSAIITEILDHITSGEQYDYAELESYLLRQHPEWATLFGDQETRAALAEFLRSGGTVGREEVQKIFEKISK